MHQIIDWNELWKTIYRSSPERTRKDRDPAAVWERRAAAYHRITPGEDPATLRDLGFINVRETDTVLDVGAGTGRLAVPLAGMVSHVTVLDPSEGMLCLLHDRMKEAGRQNYTCVKKRWEEIVIGRDILLHDVVVAAFSLGFYDLRSALEKLDAAARRSVVLFWHAGDWRGHDEMELYHEVFGKEGAREKGYPDYLFPVNILHDAGIFANVTIYPAIWNSSYRSVEDAVQNWITMHYPDMDNPAPVARFFSRVLKPDPSGRLIYTATRPTAVVYWTKETPP